MGVLALQVAARDHPVDFDDQLLVVPGLGEIIVGAQLQRVHRGLHAAVGRDHEDRRLFIALPDLLQHLHAAHVRHHQVQQDQVVGVGGELVQAFGAVLGGIGDVAFGGQQQFQAFADIDLVVDDQDLALGCRVEDRSGAVI